MSVEQFVEISEDEDFVELVIQVCTIQSRIFRERPNHWRIWRDDEFFQTFRMSKETVWYLFTQIEASIRSNTNRNGEVAADIKLLLTLRFYATGSVIRACSDFCGVDRSTGSRIIALVSHHIALLRPRFISMATGRAGDKVMAEFYTKYHFPRCIGAIGYTHIKILSPGGRHAEGFRNRKGYFSIKVQTVSDASLCHRNIVARWPGSARDSTIFSQSKLKMQMESRQVQGVLIGDGGYPTKSYLLKKLTAPTTEGERLYNEALTRAHNVVERSYGAWKRRYPILAKGINLRLKVAQAVIVATAVLHNIAVNHNEVIPEVDDETLRLINEDTPNTTEIINIICENGRTRAKYVDYFEQLVSD